MPIWRTWPEVATASTPKVPASTRPAEVTVVPVVATAVPRPAAEGAARASSRILRHDQDVVVLPQGHDEHEHEERKGEVDPELAPDHDEDQHGQSEGGQVREHDAGHQVERGHQRSEHERQQEVRTTSTTGTMRTMSAPEIVLTSAAPSGLTRNPGCRCAPPCATSATAPPDGRDRLEGCRAPRGPGRQ